MDIESMSMNLSQTQLMDTIATKVLSMSLDMAEQGAAGMVEMLEESMEVSAVSGLGGNLDITI